MDEERIVELEIKMAYQEDLVQTLNSIVIDQQEQIGRLEKTCKLLNERINNTSEPGSINQGVEIPPHY
ncbi:MAG: SlyX family protein [Methylococcaceae bacterium]